MEYVLAISLGPVQEFIAAARRSRDLWFGSWLLSELSKAAAEHIVRHGVSGSRPAGLDSLIFPAVNDPEDLRAGSSLSVVNKIIAIVEEPAATAREESLAVEAKLARFAVPLAAGESTRAHRRGRVVSASLHALTREGAARYHRTGRPPR
ncbi:MAG: hypothetical protein JOZ02_05770 [Acidobacteria bacterium]|nr:hypothetical protein [Acidobacteriota bacterium]